MIGYCPRCGTPPQGMPQCRVCGTMLGGQPYPHPPVYPPPTNWAQRARASSSATLGCGIAGCFAVLLVTVAVGLTLFFASTAKERARAAERSAEEGPREEPRGSLRDNIPSRVGGYRLAGVKPQELSGAIESLVVEYRRDRRTLTHGLSVFPDEVEAARALAGVSEAAQKKTGVAPTRSGKTTRFVADPELMVYRTGRLLGVITGDPGEVEPFFAALPY